ncbi:hypothetical protein Hanom_Chr12g01087511 [Helianthus anomalus]
MAWAWADVRLACLHPSGIRFLRGLHLGDRLTLWVLLRLEPLTVEICEGFNLRAANANA